MFVLLAVGDTQEILLDSDTDFASTSIIGETTTSGDNGTVMIIINFSKAET